MLSRAAAAGLAGLGLTLLLSWLAALLRESCQEAAWAPERVNALTASAAITLFLNDFIDGLISVTE